MSAPHTANPEVVPALPPMPEDTFAYLRDFSPQSHYFKEELQALQELAVETGHRALELSDIFPPEEIVPPAGFNSETVVPAGAVLPADQFEGRIHSLRDDIGDPIVVDLHKLVTDMGQEISYCDLRPLMRRSLSKLAPDEKGDGERLNRSLDTAFFTELKFLADTGRMRNRVSGIPGVGYAKKLGNSMARGFYMVVSAEGEEGVTIARIADSGDGKGYEEDIFRKVFQTHFKGKS